MSRKPRRLNAAHNAGRLNGHDKDAAAKPAFYIGFPPSVPKEWLEKLKVEIPRAAGQPLIIEVSKHLLVRRYNDGACGLEYADFIRKVNGRKVHTREELVAILETFKCPTAPHTVVIDIKRVRTKMELALFPSALPATAETMPGYDHIHVPIVLPPGARFGVTTRSYRRKLYVTSVEDSWNNVTKRSMLVYDAILMAGQTKISYGYDLHKALETASATDKWFLMLVERPVTAAALKHVKSLVARTEPPNDNPPIPADVWAIASRQLEHMKAHPGEEPACSLLVEDQPDFDASRPSVDRRVTFAPTPKQENSGVKRTDNKAPKTVPPLSNANDQDKRNN